MLKYTGIVLFLCCLVQECSFSWMLSGSAQFYGFGFSCPDFSLVVSDDATTEIIPPWIEES